MRNVILILLVILVCSCKTYVPIETVRYDSIYINKVQYDSIYKHDSIFTKEKGDTLYIYKKQLEYKYKMLKDTVNITKVDTVKVPYPVERNLTYWQKLKINFGEIFLFMSLVFAIIAFVKRK